MDHTPPAAAVAVVAATLTVSVVIERRPGMEPEVHFHAGGQGFWVARLIARLGIGVSLCAPVGGEPGQVLRGLIESEGVDLVPVVTRDPNAVAISDRREGERPSIIETSPPSLNRHELDDLFGCALATGMTAKVAVLTGLPEPDLVPADLYRRLAGDLRANGVKVVADLSGAALASALEGGIDLLKVSHEELVADGYAEGEDEESLLQGVQRLREAGAGAVLLSRAAEPALAHTGDRLITIAPPRVEPVNHRGGGDSMTAAAAASLASGRSLEESLQVAAAAAALNVTRQGLGTGDRHSIELLTEHVRVDEAPAPGDGRRRGKKEEEAPAPAD